MVLMAEGDYFATKPIVYCHIYVPQRMQGFVNGKDTEHCRV
jgi:hypothetical protein